MAYATADDLATAFGQAELVDRCDLDNDGIADAAMIAGSLADAAAVTDGYLTGRYTLPLSPVPPLLRRLCCDIARWYYWGSGATERVRQGYQDAIATLRDIAAGKVELVASDAPASDADGGMAFDPGSGQTLSRARLRRTR
ncbi:MAG: DUF1320 domain-containing protein [Candidatus Hydrogenedens sp.]|nr:DUF1320 domain-containing protein [Candidatus Hydrogenedens sp.]